MNARAKKEVAVTLSDRVRSGIEREAELRQLSLSDTVHEACEYFVDCDGGSKSDAGLSFMTFGNLTCPIRIAFDETDLLIRHRSVAIKAAASLLHAISMAGMDDSGLPVDERPAVLAGVELIANYALALDERILEVEAGERT